MDEFKNILQQARTESAYHIVKYLKQHGYKAKSIDNIACVNVDGAIYQIFPNWLFKTNKFIYNVQRMQTTGYKAEYQEYLTRALKAIQ